MKGSKTLLFVDDEEEILDILVDLFSEEGYSLHTATKAAEALEIVSRNTVDFVLSDLKLPDASGSELLKKIREKNPRTVRVLTSGYLDIKFGSVTEDKRDGTLYLSKPWDILTLKKLVAERLDQ
jgi:DNA-binding NtrC family response regulator